MRVPDKIKEVAKEDFEQAKELAADAVRSGAYLYPFKVRVSNLPSEIHQGGGLARYTFLVWAFG